MLSIPRSPVSMRKGSPPGSWWSNSTSDGSLTIVSLLCPLCQRAFALRHQIAGDGTVSPSVVCPHGVCGWHQFIRLDGWVAPA